MSLYFLAGGGGGGVDVGRPVGHLPIALCLYSVLSQYNYPGPHMELPHRYPSFTKLIGKIYSTLLFQVFKLSTYKANADKMVVIIRKLLLAAVYHFNITLQEKLLMFFVLCIAWVLNDVATGWRAAKMAAAVTACMTADHSSHFSIFLANWIRVSS